MYMMFGLFAGAFRGVRGSASGLWALVATLLALFAPIGPAVAQGGFGSPGVPNVGPPEAALFPDLAALQDRLEEQGWIVRGQATFVLQGHPAFRSPYRARAACARRSAPGTRFPLTSSSAAGCGTAPSSSSMRR